jgi:hypothetical protein
MARVRSHTRMREACSTLRNTEGLQPDRKVSNTARIGPAFWICVQSELCTAWLGGKFAVYESFAMFKVSMVPAGGWD